MSSASIPQIATDVYSVLDAYGQFSSGASHAAGVPGVSVASSAINVAGILGSQATEEEKAQAVTEQVGLAVADYYTAGLASTVVGLLDRYAPGLTNGIRKFLAREPVFKMIVGLFDSDKWKTEGNRLRKLIDAGVEIPESLQGALQQARGKSKEELVNPLLPLDFVGFAADGTWINNRFAMSRNERDLRPQDIWGSAAFFERFGNAWLKTFDEKEREAIAAKVLELGLVQEHHGTIDVRWSPEMDAFIQTLRVKR